MNEIKYITDFHGERKKGIGSSDIPILAGLLKKWDQTPVTLFYSKKEDIQQEENAQMEWGNNLEPIILSKFISNKGEIDEAKQLIVSATNEKPQEHSKWQILTEARHPEYNFALAHADLLNRNDEYIVEAKSTSSFAAKRRDNPDFGYMEDDLTENGIPASVYLQVQWQMFVYGVKQSYVSVLVDTSDYREYGVILPNKKVQEACLALAARFWECLLKDIPPSPQTFKDVSLVFPKSNKTTKVVGEDDLLKVKVMKDQKKSLEYQKKKIDAKINDIKTAVSLLIGENEILSSPEGETLATLTSVESERVMGLKDIKSKNPKAFEYLKKHELTKISKSRRLTV